MKFPLILVLALLGAGALGETAPPPASPVPPLLIQGTPSLVPFARDIVLPLHNAGIEAKMVDTAGNTQIVAALGAGEIDAALLTRPIKVEERAAFPEHHFEEFELGTSVVVVVVSRTVWETGIRSLTRAQVTAAYESKARNWKDLGGDDRPLQFFEPAHEHGAWEIFATWLYGDPRKAPGVRWQTVSDGPETQSALQFSSGGMSVATLRWVDRRDLFPVAVLDDLGAAIEPTVANVVAGKYPLTRPVYIAFADAPVTRKKKLLEFLQSEKSTKLIISHDFLPQSALKTP